MAQRNRNTKGIGDTVKRGWNSKPAAIGAIVVLVLVVVVVLLSTLLGVFAPAKNGEQGTASKPTPTSTSAAAKGPCNVRVTDSSSTPKIPADLTWKTGEEGLTWPVSKSVGPTKTADGFDACFARSPLGAALAAQTANYSVFDASHTPKSALEFYLADSPGKSKAVALGAQQDTAAQTRSSGLNPAGFTVDSFTKNTAVVTLVYSYPSSATGYFGTPITMVWTDGDWKAQVLDNGGAFAGKPTTPSEGDFIAWGGSSQ
jgi:hypothetical protein